MSDRPTRGAVEQRSAPESIALAADGRRLRGVIPYGVESRDFGGWREVMERGSLAGADTAGPRGDRRPRRRAAGALAIEDRDDGRSSCPMRAPTCARVERGDLKAAGWRMVVGRDEWRGDVRHVHKVAQLRDVAVVTTAGYAEARAEYRAAPEPPGGPAGQPTERAGGAHEARGHNRRPGGREPRRCP